MYTRKLDIVVFALEVFIYSLEPSWVFVGMRNHMNVKSLILIFQIIQMLHSLIC